MPSKEFLCKKCRDMHKRPINSKCPFGSPQSVEFDSENVTVPGVSGVSVQSDDSTALNVQIFTEMKSMGGRMTAMEDRMARSAARGRLKVKWQQYSGGSSIDQ